MKKTTRCLIFIIMGIFSRFSLKAHPSIKIAAGLISKQTMPALAHVIKKSLVVPYNEQVMLRALRIDDREDINRVSKLILDNFNHRPEYKLLPRPVLDLYRHSNNSTQLYEALQVPRTYGLVICRDESLLGIIVAQLEKSKTGELEMVLRRLHAALKTPGYKGIGKSLITTSAFVAQDQGISCMKAAATVPARSFLEHLGWHGTLAETPFKLKNTNAPIMLTQFKCEYMVPEKFEGFEWPSIPKQ